MKFNVGDQVRFWSDRRVATVTFVRANRVVRARYVDEPRSLIVGLSDEFRMVAPFSSSERPHG